MDVRVGKARRINFPCRAFTNNGPTHVNAAVWSRFTTYLLPAGTNVFDDMETVEPVGPACRMRTTRARRERCFYAWSAPGVATSYSRKSVPVPL